MRMYMKLRNASPSNLAMHWLAGSIHTYTHYAVYDIRAIINYV